MTVWTVYAPLPGDVEGFPGGDLRGSFTTDQGQITAWEFTALTQDHWPSSSAYCPPDHGTPCGFAKFLDPTHLEFYYFASSGVNAQLDLYLAAPLSDETVTLTKADFVWPGGYVNPDGSPPTIHYEAGVVAISAAVVPEPGISVFLVLAAVLILRSLKRRCPSGLTTGQSR